MKALIIHSVRCHPSDVEMYGLAANTSLNHVLCLSQVTQPIICKCGHSRVGVSRWLRGYEANFERACKWRLQILEPLPHQAHVLPFKGSNIIVRAALCICTISIVSECHASIPMQDISICVVHAPLLIPLKARGIGD